jgi:hypothetical protein
MVIFITLLASAVQPPLVTNALKKVVAATAELTKV